ncbi:MAG: hypothetical protein U9Q89_05600 [Thermodesulfobacteriota bacterium]|nr:hypothetical protein [Thermodesulfobacteriota bacterium]
MRRDIAEDSEKESPRILRRRVHKLLGSGNWEQVLMLRDIYVELRRRI